VAMLSVKELRTLASRLDPAQFRKQLGPFALVQRPGPDRAATLHDGLPPGAEHTTVSRPEQVTAGALALLFQFDDLLVATIPPLQGEDELAVGRQPDNELVLEDTSVSKRHAVLRWNASAQRCSVQDLGSTNGTFLNASIRLKRETILKNGDILSFGEVQFWFLLTQTLYEKLRGARPRNISL
jgi:pSer/pThr/pTyr-binding forkhead associated (FHA) protein